ncbi:MAG: hypothetical protein JXR64_08605 [Spirochaetales bacterium]|nr:hypothetical protein [Spirochaetales bacterium]
MFKKEEKCSVVASIIIIGVLITTKKIITDTWVLFYVISLPPFIFAVCSINRSRENREKMYLAINACLEESDFNVIDYIEKLRIFFKDTKDAVSYLSVVDSRILSYVFNENNSELTYKNYVKGAIKCLKLFKHSNSNIHYKIDVFSMNETDRTTTLLSAIYLVSKQLDNNSSSILISARQINNKIVIDVKNRHKDFIENDTFSNKLLELFSTSDTTLSLRV